MSKPLIPAQWREQVQEYPATCRIGWAVDLGELPDTSDATIYRDSARLEDEVFLERTHGGMQQNHYMTFETEYIKRTQIIIKACLL